MGWGISDETSGLSLKSTGRTSPSHRTIGLQDTSLACIGMEQLALVASKRIYSYISDRSSHPFERDVFN